MRLGRGDRMNAVSHRRRAQVGSIVDRAGAVTCQGRLCTARKGSSVPYFDLSAAELEAYVPQINEPTDFDAFWAITLEESRVAGWEPRLTPVDSALRSVDVFDVSFAGFGGDTENRLTVKLNNPVGQNRIIMGMGGRHVIDTRHIISGQNTHHTGGGSHL